MKNKPAYKACAVLRMAAVIMASAICSAYGDEEPVHRQIAIRAFPIIM
jgi:hypothetical protein